MAKSSRPPTGARGGVLVLAAEPLRAGDRHLSRVHTVELAERGGKQRDLDYTSNKW